MGDRDESRRVFQNARLRHHLALKSRQVERVFDQHAVPSQVTGGYTAPKRIAFDLQASLAAGREVLTGIKREVMTALGVDEVRLVRENGRLQLLVQQQEDVPVALLDVLPDLLDVEPLTAVLGILEDGAPILLDISQQDMSHVLVVGEEEAGKSALLQTIGLSLAWLNRQSQMQLIVVHAGNNGRLAPFDYLPHLLTPVTDDLEEIVNLLHFLGSEIELRESEAVQQPAIVVLVDDLDKLLASGGEPLAIGLSTLVQRGAAAGVYLVATANTATGIDDMFKAHFPVRVLGKVPDAAAATAAAGAGGTQAEYLLGKGDFLAMAGEQMHRFQAAYLDHYDFHLCLETLHRWQGHVLLAQPLAQRARWVDRTDEALNRARPFTFDGEQVDLVDEDSLSVDLEVVEVTPVEKAAPEVEGEAAQAKAEITVEPEQPEKKNVETAETEVPVNVNGAPPEREKTVQEVVEAPRPRRVYRSDSHADRRGEMRKQRPFTAPKPDISKQMPVDNEVNQAPDGDDETFIFFDDENDNDFDAWFADEEGGA